MQDQPMCCPNPVHNDEPETFAGMNIVPDNTERRNQWVCLDCGRSFVRVNGISELIK